MRATSILGPALAVLVLTGLASGACTTVGPDDDNPFGSAPPMTSTPPGTDTGDATGAGSTGGGSASTGDVPPGTTGLDSSGGTPLTTGVSAESSSSDGGGGNGMQPNDGMWSACAIPEDCGFAPTLCITINDAMGMLLAGFCSETGCANAAVDCDPSPVPTVTPVCVPVDVDGMADMACALQCTGGAACPVPMQCLSVMGLGEICA